MSLFPSSYSLLIHYAPISLQAFSFNFSFFFFYILPLVLFARIIFTSSLSHSSLPLSIFIHYPWTLSIFHAYFYIISCHFPYHCVSFYYMKLNACLIYNFFMHHLFYTASCHFPYHYYHQGICVFICRRHHHHSSTFLFIYLSRIYHHVLNSLLLNYTTYVLLSSPTTTILPNLSFHASFIPPLLNFLIIVFHSPSLNYTYVLSSFTTTIQIGRAHV